MSKYTPLKLHLQSQPTRDVPMSFADVETVLGFRLPNSAYRHRPWWANEAKGHVHAQAWLDAGYETAQVDMEGRKLVFRRLNASPRPPRSPSTYGAVIGMSEAARGFGQEGSMKKPYQPAFGALKGTFTIAPGSDLTSPMYSDEEWAEVEKEMDSDWDEIERGMKVQK